MMANRNDLGLRLRVAKDISAAGDEPCAGRTMAAGSGTCSSKLHAGDDLEPQPISSANCSAVAKR
jgi:hypothetical protein